MQSIQQTDNTDISLELNSPKANRRYLAFANK